jgi:hypothetical protein
VCIDCDSWLDKEIAANAAGHFEPRQAPKIEPDVAELVG